MPELCRFLGIVIQMYFNDHMPPHFHALYNDLEGVFDLTTLRVKGEFKKIDSLV